MPQFTLYGNRGSVSTDRVTLVLALAGFTDYDFVNLDFKTGEHKQTSHTARHPWSRIPALVLSDPADTPLYESRAIAKYLATLYAPHLLPPSSSALATARFDIAQSVEMSYFSGPASTVSWEKFAKPLLGMHTDPAAVDTAREKLETHFDAIETVLGGQAWMGGEAFGLVDCWYIPFVQRLRECGEWEGLVEWKGGKREKLGAWWEKCLGVKGVRAYVEEMPTSESIRKKFAEAAKGS